MFSENLFNYPPVARKCLPPGGSCTYFASADHGAVEINKKPPSEREGDHGVVEGALRNVKFG